MLAVVVRQEGRDKRRRNKQRNEKRGGVRAWVVSDNEITHVQKKKKETREEPLEDEQKSIDGEHVMSLTREHQRRTVNVLAKEPAIAKTTVERLVRQSRFLSRLIRLLLFREEDNVQNEN